MRNVRSPLPVAMYWPSGDQASVRIWCEAVKLRDVVASLSTVVLKLPNLLANCVGRMRFGNGGIAPLLMMQKLVDGGEDAGYESWKQL